MTRARKAKLTSGPPQAGAQHAAAPGAKKRPATAPQPPVDVVDGIPDRSAKPAAWKYVLLAIIFAVWMAVLIYLAAAG